MIPAKEDPAATAMMRALRSQPVPAPGEVLRLDGGADFLMHLRLRGLYIRDCYKQLADLMLTEPPLDYILTGTPGTGKSLLIYYFLGRLLHLPQPPPFIVWQHVLKHNRRYCYDVKTGEVRVGGLDRFEEVELANPDTWYITDGVPPDVGVRARILLITAPKRETYKEMEKASAVKLFMPLWSLEELQDCRSKVGIPVPEALVTKFFQYCGGVALYSLEQQRPATNKTFDALLDNLRGAVNACNVAQVRAAIEGAGARDMGPESIHRVIHITTDASYSRRQLVFASPWVAERFVGTALMNGDERGLMSLVNGTTGSLRGMLHEAWMHMLLPKGGGFTVAPVDFPDGMEELQRGPEQRLKLPKCKGVALFEDVADIAGERCCEGVYYRPSSSPAFPLVDSLLCAGGALYLFQMTVGGSKIADFAALEELLRKLSLASQPEPRLIFVVPEDVYATFKLSVKVGDVDNKGQAAVVEGGWTQATAEAAAAASAKGRPRRTPAPALAPVPAPVPAPAVARPKLYIMRAPLATRTKPNVRAAVVTQRGRPAARILGGLQW